MTEGDVTRVIATEALLAGYLTEVTEALTACLGGLSAKHFDEVVDPYWNPPRHSWRPALEHRQRLPATRRAGVECVRDARLHVERVQHGRAAGRSFRDHSPRAAPDAADPVSFHKRSVPRPSTPPKEQPPTLTQLNSTQLNSTPRDIADKEISRSAGESVTCGSHGGGGQPTMGA